MAPRDFYKACRRLALLPHSDDIIDYEEGRSGGNCAKAYGESLRRQGFEPAVALRLYEASVYAGDPSSFWTGFNGFRPATHFVGFRGEEYWSAVRLWGRPDFTHRVWDRRVDGDGAPGDTVIFAKGAKWSDFTFDDSATR